MTIHPGQPKLDDAMLDCLQHDAFGYFIHEANPHNGLVLDKSKAGANASIAATGLALTAYPVGVHRGFMSRAAAAERTLTTLRFFANSEQGEAKDATGYKGFYYHFLDLKSGRRAGDCELSTIDTGFLLAGMLAAAAFFGADTPDEIEIRHLAATLCGRVDWPWSLNGADTIVQGWTPEGGFYPYRWQGYDEGLFLYILALGSPTFPIPVESFAAWTKSYDWRRVHGQEYVHAGPLFTHQISHIWIDLRGIQDDYMRGKGIDYFENSRRATYAQRQYAIENPQKFHGYAADCWGITATDGPGPRDAVVDGIPRHFYDYVGRGVPDGPDDGSIAPWVTLASLPFAPEIVIPAVAFFDTLKLREGNPYGFKSTFNMTACEPGSHHSCWVSPYHFGIDQGPVVLMLENVRTGMIWDLTRRSIPFVTGLQRAGFRGGWLDAVSLA